MLSVVCLVVINLDNYCIITNFSASQKLLLKVLSRDNINLDSSFSNVSSIKIGKSDIPIVSMDYLFHENFCKNPAVLFINKSIIPLTDEFIDQSFR